LRPLGGEFSRGVSCPHLVQHSAGETLGGRDTTETQVARFET
jgi:hypothetical protein